MTPLAFIDVLNLTWVNSLLTILGIIVTILGICATIWSVWKTYEKSKQDQREQRIMGVFGRFGSAWTSHPDRRTQGSWLPVFVDSGALSLSQDERLECADRIKDAGMPYPLDSPSLRKDGDLLRKAVEQGINFNDWAQTTAFIISETVAAKQQQEGGEADQQP